MIPNLQGLYNNVKRFRLSNVLEKQTLVLDIVPSIVNRDDLRLSSLTRLKAFTKAMGGKQVCRIAMKRQKPSKTSTILSSREKSTHCPINQPMTPPTLSHQDSFLIQEKTICQTTRPTNCLKIPTNHLRIPVKPATQSGESGHPVGAKRRWGFHDVSGGRFESM